MPVDHWNQLQNACYSNQFGKLKSLLETGLSHIDQPTPEGYTPLMLSAERKDLRLARLLVSKGASLSPASNRGATALMISSQRGFLEVTNLLVEKGADLDAADEVGKTALHLAIEGQHFGVVQGLLNAGASSTRRIADGRTPLHLACLHGNVWVIKVLMDAGGEPWATDDEVLDGVVHKCVPLDVAARQGHLDAVRYIIFHTDTGLASCGGDTGGVLALTLAARCGRIEVLHTLTDVDVQVTGGGRRRKRRSGVRKIPVAAI